ncbi:hypothetical protein Cgig2_026350 [Carnegiea gigantea]|uniref:F-box domain-containing protein n=1 Tax=Carnegiea gigantea TaxID=171969 RepID=A0A9Q1KEQ3_9CARY|nr:hypothetical protein Cgig2_026350 [Carnegiea gigantea]
MSSPACQDTGGGGLGDMPESCIAAVLGHLDPPEICRLARLNRAFRGASSADFIWESKLPPNYTFLIHKLFNLNHMNHDHHEDHDHDDHDDGDGKNGEVLPPALVGFTKKDIFACLSRPNLFDDGTKVHSCAHFDVTGSHSIEICTRFVGIEIINSNLICGIDSLMKEMWLDKKTGGICLSISSKALSITGIDDRRYWNRIPNDESR